MGNIVWLASYPKSGNTWVRAFLHNLFRNAETPLPIGELGGGGITTSSTALRWFAPLDVRPPEQWSREDVDRMRPAAQEAIARSHPGTVFCKIHSAAFLLRGQPTVNPAVSAGAVYIVRDPRDVVVSYADFQGLTIDAAIAVMATPFFELPSGGGAIGEALGSWSQHVESWTGGGGPGVHVMRYEDLVERPLECFTTLVGFLGLPNAPERIARAVRHASFDELRRQEDDGGFPERSPAQERFFRRGAAGQWRDVLSPVQAARIVEAHGAAMTRMGYSGGSG